ncbi:MAG TPA: adenosylcobinamide-GDP ribazoletransferase [Nocardioidaceae bacterium]|nr:adenosylcobinamide-GDP ribazoletransferase [Nocardioidaceae bacterium]
MRSRESSAAQGRWSFDAVRLAVGTLSVLPVPPPTRVDRQVGAAAMMLAPLVGVLVAVPSAVLVWILERTDASPVLRAALAVALLALLTRAMHLDGLADTADGLGSREQAPRALEVMRRGDIGPFGVVTVVLVLLIQVSALTSLVAGRHGVHAVLGGVTLSRLVLPLACRRGVPAARTDGLGATVADTVRRVQWISVLLVALLAVVAGAVVIGVGYPRLVLAFGESALALLVGVGFCAWCVRRLGGVTGDVLGACVELTFTAVLVLAAFSPP